MRSAAGDSGPAEMVGNPAGVYLMGQVFEFGQIVEVEWISAADRKGDAVHDDRITLGDLLQHVARAASRIEKILRDDFEPIHLRLVSQQIRKVLVSQTNAEAEIGKAQALAVKVLHLKCLVLDQVEGGNASRRASGFGFSGSSVMPRPFSTSI